MEPARPQAGLARDSFWARRPDGNRPADSGLAVVMVIERHTCPCCRGERPDPAEVLIAARRLAGARPYLAAVASIVHPEDLWQLCRDELTGVDVRIGGWDIRGRWFGVVVGATPRTGSCDAARRFHGA